MKAKRNIYLGLEKRLGLCCPSKSGRNILSIILLISLILFSVSPQLAKAKQNDCDQGSIIALNGVDVNRNIEESKNHWNPLWFRNQVRNKGPWDYKQQGHKYEEFGNFNYGATGYANGFRFSETTLLREAGRAQQIAGTSKPEWGDPGFMPWGIPLWGGTPPYGDDPHDQEMIKKGIEYAKCLENKIDKTSPTPTQDTDLSKDTDGDGIPDYKDNDYSPLYNTPTISPSPQPTTISPSPQPTSASPSKGGRWSITIERKEKSVGQWGVYPIVSRMELMLQGEFDDANIILATESETVVGSVTGTLRLYDEMDYVADSVSKSSRGCKPADRTYRMEGNIKIYPADNDSLRDIFFSGKTDARDTRDKDVPCTIGSSDLNFYLYTLGGVFYLKEGTQDALSGLNVYAGIDVPDTPDNSYKLTLKRI